MFLSFGVVWWLGCRVIRSLGTVVVFLGLLGCWVSGLLGAWIVVLLYCWVDGLLGCWAVELSGC